ERAKKHYGADRIGLFLGTTTSGIGTTEAAYRQASGGALPDWFDYERTHDYFSVAGYVRRRLGVWGPAWVLSTACSSSAKVFASAARAIAAGFCDAAIVGGIDSLCLTTLYGFHSLQLVSARPCRPADSDRDGLSIGEAAGFALVTPTGDERSDRPRVLGWGESSDAYHMASPEPEGYGAARAMSAALERAQRRPEATPASSTKGWTGHTLGAAGIVETVIALLAVTRDWLPHSLNTEHLDPQIRSRILLEPHSAHTHYVCVNSFGFGGSNCSLIIGSADA
ncbi:MAG: beta-ketoacyl-[acyl-carrier-protein] synthase II, partial [Proteobacteria bacterium SW_6_67_9]